MSCPAIKEWPVRAGDARVVEAAGCGHIFADIRRAAYLNRSRAIKIGNSTRMPGRAAGPRRSIFDV